MFALRALTTLGLQGTFSCLPFLVLGCIRRGTWGRWEICLWAIAAARKGELYCLVFCWYCMSETITINLVWVQSPGSPVDASFEAEPPARTRYPAVCVRSHGILPARYALFGVFAADCSRRVSFSVTRVNMLINSSRSVPASITTFTFLPFPPSSPSRQSCSLHHETYASADTSFLNISSSCSIIMIALGSTPAGHFMSMSLSEAGYSA